MSNASQGDSASEDSDEDESESSSSSSGQPVQLATVGLPVEQETLKAVYRKWRFHTAADMSNAVHSGATDSTTVFDCLSDEHNKDLAHEEPLHQGCITGLPYEVLLTIFRWAVGCHLDTRILGRLAQVCRGFYLLSCDPCLWRSICSRQWPELFAKDAHTSRTPQMYGFASWKDMAVRRPHVLLDGCYLCRITYVRAGVAQFTDLYRQIHLVAYYRGIRFYPDGRVCMLTSAYAPNAIVAALGNSRTAEILPVSTTSAGLVEDYDASAGFTQNGLLRGTYEWCDPEFIVCTMFRPRWKEKTQSHRRLRRIPDPELKLTFCIRFRLASSKRRLHSILHWDSYVIHTRNVTTQSDHSTSLDVSSDQFPSCHFSPVRSYVAEVAPQPLC